MVNNLTDHQNSVSGTYNSLSDLKEIRLMNSAMPFALIAFAMKTLPAGGAILNALAPFFAALFAVSMLGERLTAFRLLGMALGLVGVGIIINLGPIPLTAQTLIAAAACVTATCLYGFVIALNGGAIVGGLTLLIGVALVLEVLLVKRQQAKT